MKILVSSHAFFPSVGGVEAHSAMVAEQLCLLGHEVAIVTQTPGQWESAAYKVVRRPTKWQLLNLVRWCDVFLHANISLRAAWPLLFVRRPWVIVNHGSIQESRVDLLKCFCARFAVTFGNSQESAQKIGTKRVIPQCYDDGLFRELSGEKRELELIFVGRLVSDKGVDVLLHALSQLKAEAITPRLTIVGGGPEEPSLRQLTARLGLEGQVSFVGVKRGEELVSALNRHKILVVPSTWREPFGIVALEGIACGCVVVGSEGGGLREAIGPCGMTFPNGDASALAECIRALLSEEGRMRACRNGVTEHLARYNRKSTLEAYLRVLGEVCPHGMPAGGLDRFGQGAA